MGSYLSRNRAWVYTAFYDEYVGRHINTSVGSSILFMFPLYLYGVKMNRQFEETHMHYNYYWNYFDKRSRLTHNMIMEHFEVHKEQMEDYLVQIQKGQDPFKGKLYQSWVKPRPNIMDDDIQAIVDEITGYTAFVEKYLETADLPVMVKNNIRA